MHLLHSFASDPQVAFRSRLRLLDEGMKYHHSPAREVAVESAPDTLSTTWPELEEPTTHRAGVRHPQIRTELHQELDHVRVVGQDADRPTLYLVSHAGVEVLDLVRHPLRLANVRTSVNQRPSSSPRSGSININDLSTCVPYFVFRTSTPSQSAGGGSS